MDRHSELQKLTTDACDALKAATDLLADTELPLYYRIQAHDRCMEAFRRFFEKIPEAANLLIAEETARIYALAGSGSPDPGRGVVCD